MSRQRSRDVDETAEAVPLMSTAPCWTCLPIYRRVRARVRTARNCVSRPAKPHRTVGTARWLAVTTRYIGSLCMEE